MTSGCNYSLPLHDIHKSKTKAVSNNFVNEGIPNIRVTREQMADARIKSPAANATIRSGIIF